MVEGMMDILQTLSTLTENQKRVILLTLLSFLVMC